MIEAILNALSAATAGDVLGYTGAWLVSPTLCYVYIQFVKGTRADTGRTKLSAWTLRGLAFGVTFMLAMFFAWRLAGWSLDRALNHAIAIAVSYPLLMTIILARMQKYAPDIAEDLGGNMPTEFRFSDSDPTEPKA
jgi:hypothetical protein